MNRTLRHLSLSVLATATAITLAACGGGTNPSSAPSSGHEGMPGMSATSTASATTSGTAATGPHNQVDVAFATGMIPHHGQAVTMAEMALTTAQDPSVKGLAIAIKAAQDPEIQTMSGWLRGWGQPVPAVTGGQDMPQMGAETTGSSGMGGMGGMTTEEMSQLAKAAGGDFDRTWLQMMTRHHQSAVAMSRAELATGQNQDAKTLAQSIIDSQTAEIATMTALLGRLAG